MAVGSRSRKNIVAAFLLAVCFSLPAAAQTTLDALFEDLAKGDPAQFNRLQSQIFAEWSKSGSPTEDLLLKRGQLALGRGDYVAAIEHFTAAVDHDPTFAEAYNGRATAYFNAGEYGPSIDDIRETLRLNPRHFGAMSGFAMILETIGRKEDALEMYRNVLALAPAMPNVQEALDRLELELAGREL